MTSEEDIWDGGGYTKVVRDSIFKQKFPYRLVRESSVLNSKVYKSIKSIKSKEDSGVFAIGCVMLTIVYKLFQFGISNYM